MRPTQSLSGPLPARASIERLFAPDCVPTPTENVGLSTASAELENTSAVAQAVRARPARIKCFISLLLPLLLDVDEAAAEPGATGSRAQARQAERGLACT